MCSPTSGKVLYPAAGFTKRNMIDYYTAIAPLLLGHLEGRALTVKRYPDGVEGKAFYDKQAPAHRPDWVQTVSVASERREWIDYTLAQDLATLVWLANLAALELHTPLARAAAAERPTTLVFDLDPGPPATIVECCHVGLLLQAMFEALGLQSFAKTSGSKGLQLYVPLNGDVTFAQTKPLARAVAELLERAEPDLIVFTPDQVAAPRQGAHRLEPERPTQDDRVRLLAARPRPADRLDAGGVGRGALRPCLGRPARPRLRCRRGPRPSLHAGGPPRARSVAGPGASTGDADLNEEEHRQRTAAGRAPGCLVERPCVSSQPAETACGDMSKPSGPSRLQRYRGHHMCPRGRSRPGRVGASAANEVVAVVRARRGLLADDADSDVRLFGRGDLAGAAAWTSQPPEGLQVLFVDRPDRPHLDPIEALTDQQSADVGVRGLEGGRDLGD